MSEEEYTEPVEEVKHIFPSQYEFGPANNRHTIKYFTKEELEAQLEWLREAGLIQES